MFKKPNFFVIGAPKCGTTSLAAWLAEHPNIFITKPKEPEFFNDDIAPFFSGGLKKYESLYREVQQHHVAVGEASTVYLRSGTAVKNIIKYQQDAKFIIGVRHPVNMFSSWHGQMLRNGWENEKDLKKAWRLQEQRRAGIRIPLLCPDVQHLLYEDVCALGAQLDRLLNEVGRERCFIYTLDDMTQDPGSVWKALCAFLGLPDVERGYFSIINEGSSVPKWISTLGRLVWMAKFRLGLRGKGLGLIERAKDKFSTKMNRAMDEDFKSELISFFAAETSYVEGVVGRKLQLR